MNMEVSSLPQGEVLRVSVAIVGSGPGGAVTGARLAKAGQDVAIFEEGALVRPEDTAPFSPAEMHAKLRNNGMTMALGRALTAFWEARCAGGGSEVNRGLYHRPSAPVVAEWIDRAGLDGLSPEALIDHAIDCETVAKVSDLPGPAPRVSQVLADGAEALGWSHTRVPRLFAYDPDWRTAPTPGRKQSMINTFLPAFSKAGGRFFTGIRVTRLRRVEGGWSLSATATGPEGPRPLEIRAATVFVACGATQTPTLLRRSGIRGRVGDTLAWHTMIKAVARFDQPVAGDSPLDPVHQIKHFDPRFSLGASVSNPATTTFALSDRPELLPMIGAEWRHLGCYYAQTTGGRGSVRGLPGFADPLVRAHTVRHDLTDLAVGLRHLCDCLFAAGAREIYPNIAGGPVLKGPGDLDLLPKEIDPRRVSLSTLHLMASCAMGGSEAAVTDSFGRVRGADALYLADSSILPGTTVVNPQGSIMAMASRNAEHFLETAMTRAAA